jgi:hypothetical protein
VFPQIRPFKLHDEGKDAIDLGGLRLLGTRKPSIVVPRLLELIDATGVTLADLRLSDPEEYLSTWEWERIMLMYHGT